MLRPKPTSSKVLNVATISWFTVMSLSQLLFILYIIIFYGGNTLNGSPEAWAEMTIKGHVSGDTMGNFMFGIHMFFAVILTLTGLLQLIPKIRAAAPTFHRYCGRIYISSAILLSLGGLYLVWVRGAILSINGAVAISINALLILIFSYFTIKTARAGKMVLHRKWALRAFIAVSGVWFFRVGFMAWIIIHQEAKWSTENLDGPFDLVWAYANFLIPLLILELYFSKRVKKKKKNQYALAATLFLSTLLVALGTFGAYMFMWAPNM